MSSVSTEDGTQIYCKDRCQGKTVVLSHGWPLNADGWESQILFLASNGFRVIAHDRRGHGRSTQSWAGNEMDTYADDLAAVINALNLQDVTLVGFSTGGGEVTRYLGRHGTDRLAELALVSAVPRSCCAPRTTPAGGTGRSSTGCATGPPPIGPSATGTWPTDRSSATTAPARTSPRACTTRSGTSACSPGIATPTSPSPRSPPPASAPTSRPPRPPASPR